MIERIHKCDLCKEKVNENWASRIYFINGKISKLCALNDDKASETIICKDRIDAIVKLKGKL